MISTLAAGTSLILCKAAGANIAWFSVLMALGEDIPQAETQGWGADVAPFPGVFRRRYAAQALRAIDGTISPADSRACNCSLSISTTRSTMKDCLFYGGAGSDCAACSGSCPAETRLPIRRALRRDSHLRRASITITSSTTSLPSRGFPYRRPSRGISSRSSRR